MGFLFSVVDKLEEYDVEDIATIIYYSSESAANSFIKEFINSSTEQNKSEVKKNSISTLNKDEDNNDEVIDYKEKYPKVYQAIEYLRERTLSRDYSKIVKIDLQNVVQSKFNIEHIIKSYKKQSNGLGSKDEVTMYDSLLEVVEEYNKINEFRKEKEDLEKRFERLSTGYGISVSLLRNSGNMSSYNSRDNFLYKYIDNNIKVVEWEIDGIMTLLDRVKTVKSKSDVLKWRKL